ncbi:ATP-binding protein [Geoglobus sp.]
MRLQTKLVTVIVFSFLFVLYLSVLHVAYSMSAISDSIEGMVVELESESILRFLDIQISELEEEGRIFLSAGNYDDRSLLDVLDQSSLSLVGASFAAVADESGSVVLIGNLSGNRDTLKGMIVAELKTMRVHEKGVILLDKPAIFAAFDVGGKTVIFFRYFDDGIIDSLVEHEDVNVRVSERYVETEEYRVEGKTLTVYLPVHDVSGRVAVVIEYEFPAYWRDLSRLGVVSTIIFVSATTVAVGVAALVTLGRDVSRIRRLSDFMESITRNRDFGRRADSDGDDEISQLAASINRMLDEIERYQRDLKNANENLRLLNSILRHDLLNRLTRILAYAEMGYEERNPEFYREILEAVEDSVRLIERVRNLEIAFSDFKPSKMNLRQVIEEVMGEYDLEYSVDGDATVLADEGLYSVLDNLVHNAIKHGGTNRIDFKIAERDGRVELRVIDYGRGIPDEFKRIIFEEGFSTANSSGLGLYIVKRIVERYGGSVWVEDSRPSGAVFVILLPKA